MAKKKRKDKEQVYCSEVFKAYSPHELADKFPNPLMVDFGSKCAVVVACHESPSGKSGVVIGEGVCGCKVGDPSGFVINPLFANGLHLIFDSKDSIKNLICVLNEAMALNGLESVPKDWNADRFYKVKDKQPGEDVFSVDVAKRLYFACVALMGAWAYQGERLGGAVLSAKAEINEAMDLAVSSGVVEKLSCCSHCRVVFTDQRVTNGVCDECKTKAQKRKEEQEKLVREQAQATQEKILRGQVQKDVPNDG